MKKLNKHGTIPQRGICHKLKFFETITDPRQPWKTDNNLHEIVVMTICAVMSGCEIWEEITDFSKVKADWFREKLDLALENGVASHDTFQRVFQVIKPEELEESFALWVRSIATRVKGEIVSIDGKTVCGSKSEVARAIHMVSAWGNTNQLVLGQVKTDEKSNEITAIPALLDLLELKDIIITRRNASPRTEFLCRFKHGHINSDFSYYTDSC